MTNEIVQSYKVNCECMNCGYEGEQEQPKGKEITNENVECPNCGCKKARLLKYRKKSTPMTVWPVSPPSPPKRFPYPERSRVWCEVVS
jgi:DNA-directed RNA polymerase subunit RPC12/RpoP